MSRSYRKPYCAITGWGSAKQDKRRAARAVRRTQEQWLNTLRDPDAALAPHPLECPGNDVWSWDREGKPRRQVPSREEEAEASGPPVWYRRLQRK